MAADFIVGMEVQPRGAGLQQVARETKVLTAATQEYGQESRRAKTGTTELDASERRRRATLDELARATKANNLALAQARTDHARYQQQVEAAAEAKRRATGVVNSFRAAIVALQVAVAALGLGALVRDSVNVALAFDRAEKSLVAATGSTAGAGREMAFVTAEADRLGLVLSDTAQAYAGLAAAARNTALEGQGAREIFSAVAESASVMGLSAEQANGALLSIQQMMSKGTVQAEELRGQLGERLPGAFQIAARAMGTTTAGLGKMLEQGKVTAAEMLPKLAAELRKTFGPGLATALNSAQANLNRFRNAIDQVKSALGEGFLSGFLAGFSDLRKQLSAEELKAAARDLGESIGKSLRTAADALMLLARNLEIVKALLMTMLALKVASWFVGLAGAIATATGATITFKAATSNLALAGGLGAVGVALLAVIVIMEKYISTTRAAHAAEMEKVARSQELFGYYQTLKANKVGLTEQEALYAVEVRKTMEAERAALVVSLQRAKAEAVRNQFAPAPGFAPSDTARQEGIEDLEREIQTIDNMLNGLEKEWDRLGKLPTIKPPVDPAEMDKAAKKIADLLTGFQRAAEQAEQIRAAQASEGAAGVARVTAEIERENAAYQALHSMENLSAASKAKLSGIIEGLVGRTQEANRATAEGTAETQRSLAFAQAASDAEALLADAKSQTTAASRLAAIQAEAEGIARENLKEGDAEYVAGLLTVIRTRRDYLDGIALEIAAIQRQTEQVATLRQKRAELADAQEEGTAATRRLAVELEAETEARARGIQVGTIWYQLLLAISAQRAQEVQALDQQTAAQRRLNDAQSAQRQARADFVDWNRQREAANEYGSEIAGILQSYGLLSEATRDLAIHEEALALSREAGNTRTVEQIEQELRGYAAIEESLARQAAAIELQAYIIQPGIEAWQRVGETIQSAVIDQIVDGNVKIEDLWKSMARTFLQAIAEMLKRWLLAHKAMQAEAMKTAAVNAAAAQAGGGTAGGFGNVGGGTGGMGALFGMGRQVMGGGGGAAGAGWSTAASIGAVVAIYAAVYIAASKWVESHKTYMGEVTFQLQQDVGGLVSNINGNYATVKGLTKQVTEAGKAVVDWIKTLGGEVETAIGTAAAQLTIGRKGQGKNTSWYVQLASGIKEWFASQEDAFSFAMVEALRQAEISGLDPIVLAAIKRNTFKTLEELQQGIADAVKVASFGQPGVAADFRAGTAEMDRLRASMREMIGTGAELADALGRINSQELLLIQSQRDAITGKKRTAAEEYQMELLRARAWNAEREVRLQSINMQIQEVKARIANYRSAGVLIGGPGGNDGKSGSGLLGLGRAILYTANVVATATEVIAGSGDAGLDALNAYLKSLQDLYDALAAMPPIDPSEVPRPGADRGGLGAGGGGGDRKQGRLDLLAEVQSWKLTDIGRQLQAAGQWFDDFKERLKDLGFSAKRQAELLAAAKEELERQRQEIKTNQLTASRDFINAGTAAGGPLMSAMNQNRDTQLKLIAANRDLQKQGLLSQREMRELNRAIHEAGVRQRDQMIGTAADQLFLDLYGLLGDEQAAAQLRFDLTLAELDLRREELRLAMEAAGWTKERMDAILEPLGVLIQRVKDAGPGIFGPPGPPPPNDGGGQSTSGSGYYDMNGVWHPTWGSGSNDNNNPQAAALELMAQYRNAGRNEYELAREKVENDFAQIRAALGDTGEVADLFAAAMGRLRNQFLEGVQEFYDALSSGQASGQSVEQQYGAAMANYQNLLLAVQGGDLSQANALAQAGQDLVNLAGQMWGTSTGGFAELREQILAQLRDLLGVVPPEGPAAPPALADINPGFGANRGTGSGGGRAVELPDGQKQVKATEKVADTVDLMGRKIEAGLRRLEDVLTRIEAKEAAMVVPPQTYGQGGR